MQAEISEIALRNASHEANLSLEKGFQVLIDSKRLHLPDIFNPMFRRMILNAPAETPMATYADGPLTADHLKIAGRCPSSLS